MEGNQDDGQIALRVVGRSPAIADMALPLGGSPDPASRLAPRLRQGRRELQTGRRALLRKFRRSPIAQQAEDANRQHYEVPTCFFQLVLGKRMKYSCCLWPPAVTTLDQAEEVMLQLTCQRAGIQDGMRILDLGCGWGSLSLWIAEHYPGCQVVALIQLSNPG